MPRPKRKLPEEAGHIISLFSGVARVADLSHLAQHETLVDAKGRAAGIVIGFDEKLADVLMFDEDLDATQPLYASGEIFNIKTSQRTFGRVLDGLGRPLDGKPEIVGNKTTVFRPAPQIIEREPINEALVTGIKLIDATLPIGRGQRELIIGDRKLGKSTIAIDTVLNQRWGDPPVKCVYVLCGQKRSILEELVELLQAKKALPYTIVVAAGSNDSFAAQYLAPFVGCTLAEQIRDKGEDALVIFDDLSKHAKAYRDIALLLKRAPGREAYPGDIFSLHATLLERAAKLSKRRGGGSLTALPIIETQEGDIASYIPTNLISITDGQIYLERSLHQKGVLPSVNIGLSVSRVGSEAQIPLVKDATQGIRLSLAQYKELQRLTQLEAAMNQTTNARITRGDVTTELLKQPKHTYIAWEEQAALFYALREGLLDHIPKEDWAEQEDLLLQLLRHRYPQLLKQISTGKLKSDTPDLIKKWIADFDRTFLITDHEDLS